MSNQIIKVALSTVIMSVMFLVTSFAAHAADSKKPEVYAVMYYADWCGSCKTLDPKIESAKAQNQLNAKDVLFLKLDFTDEADVYQSELLVDALELQSSYAKYGDKTGFMLLIDADSKQVLSRLTKQLSVDDITARINGALAKAQG